MAILLGALLVWKGQDWYHALKARQQLSLAQSLVEEGDMAGAIMATRNALMADPDQAEAAQLMARMAESAGSPMAVHWWSRAAELQPGNAAIARQLAETALRFDDVAVARNALTSLAESDRTGANYHRLAGGVALREGNTTAARQHFALARELSPNNALDELNLATLDLVSATDGTARLKAVAALDALRGRPATALLATRALLRDALDHQDRAGALTYAEELPRQPGAGFPDELLRLQVLSQLEPSRVDGDLSRIRNAAATHPQRIYALLTWMASNGREADAIAWAETFPPEVRANSAVQIALASSLAALGEWEQLRANLVDASWGSMDFLRLAWLARAAREEVKDWHPLWTRAISTARANPSSLQLLATLAAGWGWERETVRLWEELSRMPPHQEAALRELYLYHSKRHDTAAMLEVFEQAVQINPDDATARNNHAALQLLLKRNTAQALAEARTLWEQSPTHPGYATTYALGCLRMGLPQEGLAALESLPSQALADPSIALYHGLLLEANGQPDDALRVLQTAEEAEVLPEERALADAATDRARAARQAH